MSRRILLLSAFLSLGLLTLACNKPDQPIPLANIAKDYNKPLAPGQFALKLVDPAHYPRFADAWYKAKGTGLREAVQHSINYLKKPSSQKYYPLGPITHDRAMLTLTSFLEVLDGADSPQALDEAIRQGFDVYASVGCDDEGTVLFTGYYSPIFDGSLTQTEKFKYPLYKLPAGFKKDEEGNPIGGPYKTRQEIETSQEQAGNEIAWLGDRFEAYVFTVQGSGFIRLPDGQLYEIGYAGHNGQEYTPIGRQMVLDGKIDRFKLSLDTMIRYFKEHAEDLDHYLYMNKRYVFFQDSKGGPYGCLGEVVMPFHSIATDKDIFPRGSLSFVDTRVPNVPGESMRPMRSFVLDQDRGAAIRAPGRCDIYMGVGDAAGKMAGFTFSEGKLYYLVAREGAKKPATVAKGPQAAPAAGGEGAPTLAISDETGAPEPAAAMDVTPAAPGKSKPAKSTVSHTAHKTTKKSSKTKPAQPAASKGQ